MFKTIGWKLEANVLRAWAEDERIRSLNVRQISDTEQSTSRETIGDRVIASTLVVRLTLVGGKTLTFGFDTSQACEEFHKTVWQGMVRYR